jgi:DNA N-6-adenine-methyltransferase Dam
MQQELQLLLSHESVEWYTPKFYTDLVKSVMSDIDLDPASNEIAQAWIGARRFYTKADNGLSRPWQGRVWLNPPYSKSAGRSNQDIWAEKLINEYRVGNVTEAIMLSKAVTGYVWFENVWDSSDGICFARELINFARYNGSPAGASKWGSAFFYWGKNYHRFEQVFSEIGRCYPNTPTDEDKGQLRMF